MTQPVQQAGAIVVRVVESVTQVLLILSKKKPQVRIFPKGHIEIGETSADAAHRELLEEAGIQAELIKNAGEIAYEWDNKPYHVTYFLFKYLYNVSNGEDGRDPLWIAPIDAYNLLPSDMLRELLRVTLNLSIQ